jgi:hypothetical protein
MQCRYSRNLCTDLSALAVEYQNVKQRDIAQPTLRIVIVLMAALHLGAALETSSVNRLGLSESFYLLCGNDPSLCPHRPRVFHVVFLLQPSNQLLGLSADANRNPHRDL